MADYVVADAQNIGIKPAGMPFEEAAALTIVGLTAWTALVAKAKLSEGQMVFVNGCLGAVGRSAVQIARMCGASVVGACSPTDFGAARTLGVSETVDYRALEVHAFARRFDVVFDTAGALSLRQCGVMLKPSGMSLHIVPNLAKWAGSLFSSRHHLVFGNPTPESFAGIAEAAERGILVPVIGRTVPLSEAIPAIAEFAKTGSPKGKLIIAPE